jgi:hypothetical protein
LKEVAFSLGAGFTGFDGLAGEEIIEFSVDFESGLLKLSTQKSNDMSRAIYMV